MDLKPDMHERTQHFTLKDFQLMPQSYPIAAFDWHPKRRYLVLKQKLDYDEMPNWFWVLGHKYHVKFKLHSIGYLGLNSKLYTPFGYLTRNWDKEFTLPDVHEDHKDIKVMIYWNE